MLRFSVSSSNLQSVGYDPLTKTLEIEFKSSGLYQYYGVPEEVFIELMAAGSKGKYHHQNIKGKYAYDR